MIDMVGKSKAALSAGLSFVLASQALAVTDIKANQIVRVKTADGSVQMVLNPRTKNVEISECTKNDSVNSDFEVSEVCTLQISIDPKQQEYLKKKLVKTEKALNRSAYGIFAAGGALGTGLLGNLVLFMMGMPGYGSALLVGGMVGGAVVFGKGIYAQRGGRGEALTLNSQIKKSDSTLVEIKSTSSRDQVLSDLDKFVSLAPTTNSPAVGGHRGQ